MSPVAVVTGAARGIGAATVDLLVESGWQVVAVDRSADDPALDYALATKADLEAVAERHGAGVRTMVGDVRSQQTCGLQWTRPSPTSAVCRRRLRRPA